jgi:ABC-type nitrate/sulfonate/bicarbonate transport system permease component
MKLPSALGNGRNLPFGGVLVLFLLGIAWELLYRLGVYPPYLLPGPSQIASVMLSRVFMETVAPHLGLTVFRALVGFVLASALGVTVGLLIGRSDKAKTLLDPLIESLRPLPASGLVPVALLFFGLGTEMAVFVVSFGATWPVLVASAQGARHIDPLLLDTARLFRLNFPYRLGMVLLPASAPYILAGLRTSLAVSLILSVTAEMVGGTNGMGFIILDFERAFRTPEMYATLVILGLTGYTLNKAFEKGEERILYWIPKRIPKTG